MSLIKNLTAILLFIAVSANSIIAKTEFTIFHTNDLHARVLSDKHSIGFAKLATYILQHKTDKTIFIDAGDTFYGSPLANFSKGELILELLNYMQLDAMAPGNHDFTSGVNNLIDITKRAKFNILAANINYKDPTKKAPFKASYIKKISPEVTVGILGLATPETAVKTHPDNVAEINFLSLEKTAAVEVANLKALGANFIIVIGHLGNDDATLERNRSTILANVKGIDLIIDGHTHTKLNTKINNVTIVRSGEHDDTLGVVKVTIDNDKKTIKASTLNKASFNKVAEDLTVKSIIQNYTEKYNTNNMLYATIGKTNIVLDGSRNNVRSRPTNLSLLVAKLMKDDLKTDIAFIHGGSIRETIEKGDVNMMQILTALPGGVNVKISLTGKEIIALLNVSYQYLPAIAPIYMHTAGITYKIAVNKKKGNHVTNVFINGKPIDEKKVYSAATTNALAAGLAGFTMLATKPVEAKSASIGNLLANYIKQVKQIEQKNIPQTFLRANKG